jgi:hypothetical protein
MIPGTRAMHVVIHNIQHETVTRETRTKMYKTKQDSRTISLLPACFGMQHLGWYRIGDGWLLP